MQDVTPWPESFDVSQPVARVLVDGQEVDVESVTVSADLDFAAPERVAAGGGGVVAATGTASILRADAVAEAGFNPWGDAEQFVEASEVVVEAGYRDPTTGGVGCARQITAQVESLDGGATASHVDLEFVDHTPLLDRDITIEPLLSDYPSLTDGFYPRRGAGLSPIYITDRVLRHCGLYATPPMVTGAVVSAPLMGSAIAERGTMWRAQAQTNEDLPVAFRPVAWGMALGNGIVYYTPDFGGRGHGRLNSDIHVSFHRQASTNSNPENSFLDLRWGSSNDAIRITAHWSGQLFVHFRQGGVQHHVVTLPSAAGNASESYSIRVQPDGTATVYASNGVTVTGSATVPSRFVTQSMTDVMLWVPQAGHPIGGLQVAFSRATTHEFVRTAHIDPPAYYYSLPAFPARINVNCLNLLKEQAAAELAAMWFDEFGNFRWRNRHLLTGTTPQGTLTSQRDLYDLSWSVPVRSVFSMVEIEHQTATVTKRAFPSITVSDSRGSTLTEDDTEDKFFGPPANQDWHMVDPPQWVGGTVDYYALIRGRGSYRGGLVVDDDNNERLAYSTRLSQVWSQIGPQRWLLSSHPRDLAVGEYVEQSHRDRPDLYGRFAGENLPIIRAKGLTEWDDQTTTGAARGPVLAPVFTHQVGPWIQGASEIQSLANWLAQYLTKPDVILKDVPIVPDPRIQLGDVFWLEDQTAYHVRLKIVVMGKSLTYQATNTGYEMTQTITCRVMETQRLHTNYAELQAAWEGRDYAALESAWAGQDYDALEADPLDRS